MSQKATIGVDQSQTVAERFTSIRGLLDDAMQRVKNGDLVSLEGLDGRIQDLCKAVMALPEETARRQVPEFETLWNELHNLQHVILETRSQVVSEYQALNNVRRAHVAYKTSDARDGQMIGGKTHDDATNDDGQ